MSLLVHPTASRRSADQLRVLPPPQESPSRLTVTVLGQGDGSPPLRQIRSIGLDSRTPPMGIGLLGRASPSAPRKLAPYRVALQSGLCTQSPDATITRNRLPIGPLPHAHFSEPPSTPGAIPRASTKPDRALPCPRIVSESGENSLVFSSNISQYLDDHLPPPFNSSPSPGSDEVYDDTDPALRRSSTPVHGSPNNDLETIFENMVLESPPGARDGGSSRMRSISNYSTPSRERGRLTLPPSEPRRTTPPDPAFAHVATRGKLHPSQVSPLLLWTPPDTPERSRVVPAPTVPPLNLNGSPSRLRRPTKIPKIRSFTIPPQIDTSSGSLSGSASLRPAAIMPLIIEEPITPPPVVSHSTRSSAATKCIDEAIRGIEFTRRILVGSTAVQGRTTEDSSVPGTASPHEDSPALLGQEIGPDSSELCSAIAPTPPNSSTRVPLLPVSNVSKTPSPKPTSNRDNCLFGADHPLNKHKGTGAFSSPRKLAALMGLKGSPKTVHYDGRNIELPIAFAPSSNDEHEIERAVRIYHEFLVQNGRWGYEPEPLETKERDSVDDIYDFLFDERRR